MSEQFEVQLKIDNQELSFAQVFCLFQKDPFPGGHQYQLQIQGKDVKKVFHFIKKDVYLNPERNLIERCFWHLDDICSGLNVKNDNLVIPELLLNNILEIVLEGNTVTFRGICSEKI